MHIFTFEAIGTNWQIDSAVAIDGNLRERLLARAEAFDLAYSRFRDDSIVSRMASATAGGTFVFPEDAVPLFHLYDRLHEVTGGGVDPLVGRDLELLGYNAGYSLRPDIEAVGQYRQNRPRWDSDVVRRGTALQTNRPLVVDVGAAGKGYLIDIFVALLSEHGHRDVTVDGSGDIRHRGESTLDVGLEHPDNSGLIIGTARLTDQAICASASNRRSWGDGLHHVLDGRTGVPTRDIVATWAIAADALTADGLATALFFTKPDRLRRDFDFTFVRMFSDGRADWSPDFEGELFT